MKSLFVQAVACFFNGTRLACYHRVQIGFGILPIILFEEFLEALSIYFSLLQGIGKCNVDINVLYSLSVYHKSIGFFSALYFFYNYHIIKWGSLAGSLKIS